MRTEARIFVVDDEATIAWSSGMILKARGFDTSTFTNPCEALEKAAVEFPDLLITDIKMPEMSGIELAIQVTALCPQCQILLLSGCVTAIDWVDSARKLGHDFEFLQKPVHPDVLLAAVRQKFIEV